MINAKSSVKLLRRLGIALIAMPEAVTTPIGVALILTSRYLSKKIEADLYKRLHGTFQHYLAHSKRHAKDADTKPDDRKQAKRTARNADRLIPIQAEVKPVAPMAKSSTRSGERLIPVQDKNSIKANPAPSAIQNQTDAEAEAAVHHSIDIKWLARRYEMPGNKNSSALTSDEEDSQDNLIRHSIDRQKLAGRFNTEMSKTTDSGSTDNSERGVMHRITSTPLRDYHSSVKW